MRAGLKGMTRTTVVTKDSGRGFKELGDIVVRFDSFLR